MPLSVRVAAVVEYPEVARLTVAAYEALVGPERLFGYRDELEDVAGRAAAGTVLVAVDGADAVLGAVTYVPGPRTPLSEFDDDDACGIRMLAVDPARQGGGAGRALTVACIERAQADGRGRIVLHSTSAMEIARGMYERLGFERTPRRDVIVPSEDLAGEAPLHLMAYELVL